MRELSGREGSGASRQPFLRRVRRLRDDPLNVSRRGLAPRRATAVRLALPVLMLVTVALLLLSRIDHSATRALRTAISDAIEPVLSLGLAARDRVQSAWTRVSTLADADAELIRLRRENAELKDWRARAADLQARVEELAKATHAPQDSEWPFLSARVIADGTGGFVRSVLINAGRDHNLRIGYPVVTRDGLVGRIVSAGRRSANVLLIGDVTSRVPVLVGRSKVRAVLAGEDGGLPRLIFVAGGEPSVDDEVMTSGTGGVFPRGLKIGRVASAGADARVRLNARLDEVDEVSVLLYDTAAADLVDDPERSRVKEASRARTPRGEGSNVEVER